jgi:AcrR family transcriptional regulator
MTETPNNETWMRILDVADELFSKRGYTGVRLRDIANALGMKHASLYYYAPGGKEQLFVQVMERNFQRHYNGLTTAITEAPDDLREQMVAAAAWLSSQPLLDLSRMIESDTHEIDQAHASRLMNLAYDALRMPLVEVLRKAQDAGIINVPDLDLTAMAFVSLIGSVHHIPREYGKATRAKVARQLVDMLLNGWLVR